MTRDNKAADQNQRPFDFASNPPRGSHVIPARLLSQFGSEHSASRRRPDRRRWKVWRYARDVEPKHISISELFENDFYSYKEQDGQVNYTHECRMADRLEKPFNHILPLLESDLYVTTQSHAEVIFRYVANLFHRSHQRREGSFTLQDHTESIARELLDDPLKIRQLTAAFSFVLRRPVAIQSVFEVVKTLSEKKIDQRNTYFLSSMELHEEALYEMLRGRSYGTLRSPSDKAFIISDTAIVTRVPLGDDFSIGEGFSKPNMHTLLPISPKTCLQIGLQHVRPVSISDHEVDLINRDSIRLMHRWVYGLDRDPRIQKWVNDFGGSVRYSINAFVTPPLTTEDMLNRLVSIILQDAKNPEWRRRVMRTN